MVDNADRARAALPHYDAGILLGPARAENWRLEEKWTTAAELLTAKIKPDHFSWHEATNFWSSISKTDGWHAELTDENKTKMAQWLIDAAEFVYVPYLLRNALGSQCRDGDIVSDVATEKISVDCVKKQMEKDWEQAQEENLPASSPKGRPEAVLSTPVASPRGKPPNASPQGTPGGVVHVEDEKEDRKIQIVDGDNGLADKEGASSEPYEGGATWQAQLMYSKYRSHPTKEEGKYFTSVSKVMCKELRHKTNRRNADYSLSPGDLAHIISRKMTPDQMGQRRQVTV